MTAARAKRFPRECEWCGDDFLAKPSQRYCSPECRDLRDEERDRERIERLDKLPAFSMRCPHEGCKRRFGSEHALRTHIGMVHNGD